MVKRIISTRTEDVQKEVLISAFPFADNALHCLWVRSCSKGLDWGQLCEELLGPLCALIMPRDDFKSSRAGDAVFNYHPAAVDSQRTSVCSWRQASTGRRCIFDRGSHRSSQTLYHFHVRHFFAGPQGCDAEEVHCSRRSWQAQVRLIRVAYFFLNAKSASAPGCARKHWEPY